jgi:L-ribulokinase
MVDGDCVIGVDFGSDSVRALVVDTTTGAELGSAVHAYRRWAEGKYCDADAARFRQHPLDYIEGLEASVTGALAASPAGAAERVRGLAVDTTGSTPVAVDAAGLPLALRPEFADNPNAMFVLWKDHTAVAEADEITELARSWGGVDYTKYEGGIYSSEWFWAKILHVLREDAEVRAAAHSWVEHCDWIPALLTGAANPQEIKRSRCAAGHKAMWHADFDGLPSEDFLVQLDPLLAGLRARLYQDTYTCDVAAGRLSAEWAQRLGLSETVVVGVGAFDAHLGAVGAGIRPGVLTKVMGTSTCDMLVAPNAEIEGRLIPGICGQVDGSILPGMQGMEAGQSAFGDVYAWFSRLLMWTVENVGDVSEEQRECIRTSLIAELSQQALQLPPGGTGVVALDWFNGRRTPDADTALKAMISGLTLGSSAPAVFRALVEATAFGARAIQERFENNGVAIQEVRALGGVAKKSELVMQVLADVLQREIGVVRSEQACALGTAICAAVAAELYPSVDDAQQAMQSDIENVYRPNAQNAEIYNRLYAEYCRLGQRN